MASTLLGLPDELTAHILLRASTPTFIQLTRTSTKFFNVAAQNRKLLLHHLNQIPGDKSKLKHASLDNQHLFLLLRQRAANALTGVNFTANMHEYLARHASIIPAASSVGGLDADYVRMALCFKDTADIRQYTNNCAIKEKIKQISAPGTQVLKLVQRGRFVSVLCASPSRQEDDFSDASDSDRSDSESDMLFGSPFSPTANARLQRLAKQRKPRNDRLLKLFKVDQRYQVIHFDVYTIEDSQIFEIIPPADMVPRDFAVQNSSLCAILWDKETPGGRPTEDANVVTYTIDTRIEDIVYEQKTVWPKAGKPARTEAESDDEDTPENLPERIAFFKDGRRIKMYGAGGVVPYQIFATSTTQYDQYASTNVIPFDGFSVHVDTPFFGTHTTQVDELNQQSYCFQHHLCLGIATLSLSNGASEDDVKVLCILRSQNRYYPDSCDHGVSLSRMTHVSATNSTIAARLWGWEETHTSFSGKDVIAFSPGGTRIAIAVWDKVLVYPLNPKVLCDEVVVDSSDDELPKLKKKKRRLRKSWETPCTDYYQRPKDKNFLGWRVAEIRPIVLDLQGAIAHSMSWSPAKAPITDTEPKVVPAPDEGNGESEVAKEVEDSTDATADQTTVPVVAASEEAQVIESESTNAISHAAMQEMEPSIIDQGSVSHLDETSNLQSTIDDSILNLQSTTDESPKPIPQSTTTELVTDVQSGQISPSEPQSPTQPTKKNESLQALGTFGSSAPNSPPTALSSFSSTLSSSPFSLYGASNPSQPSKLSIRKKEKASEANSLEAITATSLEKKFQSVLSLSSLDDGLNNETLPSLIKTGYQLTQTVAEALAGSAPATIKSPVEIVPNVIVAASVETTPGSEQTASTKVPSVSEIEATPPPDVDQEDNVATDHSKKPSATMASSNQDRTQTTGEKVKTVKRKQRVTEDELIILTDRGVQVWNLGASAKGERKRSYLKLEESLRGKLPRLKGKSKEAT